MPSSPDRPRIAFVTTVKNRTSHIRQTLPRNLADNIGYRNAVFIVLDYCDSDGLLDYLCVNHMTDIESGLVVVYSYREPGAFKMAHAKNMAHRLGIMSGADILVNLDADNYTGKGFAQYVADQLADRPESFLWANIIPGQGKQFRGCNGRICVTRDQFILSGGYDEKFSTWSPDDKDFNARLQRMGYQSIEIDRQYLRAIPHKDGIRFREYPHAQRNAYEYEQSACESTSTIANWGRIGCGTVYRNLHWDCPIEIHPIPTRIFGIGLHKTATNSLHKALTIIGLDSAHWGSPKRARSIWQEMKDTGRSATIEHHYAWLDLPIPLLFRELDRAYPNSKFILTIRDESKWLSSVQNHWDYGKNIFRSSWDTDPFTHLIHKELYGCKWPGREIFINRYRRHNAAVIDWFKHRPDDLLVLNVDCGDGWPELCRFIGVPDPPIVYPSEYATPKGV